MAKGRQQLLVQQRLANGLVRDLSREALFTSSDPSVVSVADGVAHALGEGLAKVRVEAAGQVASVDVVVGPKPSGARLSFVADVLPVLGRAGCRKRRLSRQAEGTERIFRSRFSHSIRRPTFGRS